VPYLGLELPLLYSLDVHLLEFLKNAWHIMYIIVWKKMVPYISIFVRQYIIYNKVPTWFWTLFVPFLLFIYISIHLLALMLYGKYRYLFGFLIKHTFMSIWLKPLYNVIFAITSLFARSQKWHYRGVRLYMDCQMGSRNIG